MKANVKSIESIRVFRTDLQEYKESLRQSLDILLAELTRAVDYFESDRAAYWPAQVRRASDKLAEARINLERCQVTTRPEQGPSCYEEKKALQKAKARLQHANEKVKATKKWVIVVQQEVDQFRSRLAQLNFMTDTELPRAMVLLERLASRLDRYADRTASHPGDK
ncbi:MAG: hypothetical protein AAF497_24650 [Planctomycetota bacterium]